MTIDKQALREEFRFMQVHYSDPADRARQVIYIAAEALLDELESAEKTSAARLEAIDRTHKMFQRERDRADAAERRVAEQSAIVAAAEKLVRCKGRYHSELNYRALAKLFGVNTPDLPHLDGESRTVMMPEPFKMAKSSSVLMYYYADEVDKALAAAGIKVKGE
ncbi:ead/Ea22-like family protein [Salmonella enterica]|nr:ead/Ea22-like family protein [Salmonella enterica]